jgi:hypothetical protein
MMSAITPPMQEYTKEVIRYRRNMAHTLREPLHASPIGLPLAIRSGGGCHEPPV